MKKRYIALVPAYEPGCEVLSLIKDLKEKGFEIVIVDDGSGDDYSSIFRKAEDGAIVLTHEVNKGKGTALKTGMKYIYEHMSYSESRNTGGEISNISGRDAVIVTVDADGQHRAEDALRIAEIAARKRDSLVLGSRTFEGEVPARSMAGNTITRHVYSMATGLSIRDTQTGLRAFSRDMIPALLEIGGDRYEYEMNVLLELAASGTNIIEEDIATIYNDDNSGSHFNTIKDSFRVYRQILKFSASSLISFVIDYAMFALLLAIGSKLGMESALAVSNIGARLVSAMINYNINRRLVFRSDAGIAKSAAQYFTLAAIILTGNTIVLKALVHHLGIGSLPAKLVTEIIFFIISWTVQKYIIFYKNENDADDTDGKKRHAWKTLHAEGK